MPPESGEQFTRLLIQNQKRIWGLILSLVPNGSDADDILQETCAVMWRKYSEFEPGTDFAAWGLSIARFQVMRYYSRRKSERARLSDEVIEAVALDFASPEEAKRAPARNGQRIGVGHFRLTNGIAKLRFDVGAEVDLEGPAYLEVLGQDRCRLHRGKLVVTVENDFKGFTVDTPRGQLMDDALDNKKRADGVHASPGSFADGSTVKNVHAIFGTNAIVATNNVHRVPKEHLSQLRVDKRETKNLRGPSVCAVTDRTKDSWSPIIENVTSEGFKYNSGVVTITEDVKGNTIKILAGLPILKELEAHRKQVAEADKKALEEQGGAKKKAKKGEGKKGMENAGNNHRENAGASRE